MTKATNTPTTKPFPNVGLLLGPAEPPLNDRCYTYFDTP